MRISVILPTYDRPELLDDALASLFAQSFPHDQYEILVVDNAAQDSVARAVMLAAAMQPVRVDYVRTTQRGLQHARHAGAHAAKGQILAFTDDDVLVDRDWLRELAEVYAALAPDAAGGRIDIQWDRTPPDWVRAHEAQLGKLDYGPQTRILNAGQFINGANFSILRSRLFEIGGFNPDQIGSHLVGDGETGLCRRIHKASWRIAWAPNARVLHRQFVDRHGTLADLKRRSWNNGVCWAYNNFRARRSTRVGSARQAASDVRQLISLTLESVRTPKSPESTITNALARAHTRGRLSYDFRLATKAALRRSALRDDWIGEESATSR